MASLPLRKSCPWETRWGYLQKKKFYRRHLGINPLLLSSICLCLFYWSCSGVLIYFTDKMASYVGKMADNVGETYLQNTGYCFKFVFPAILNLSNSVEFVSRHFKKNKNNGFYRHFFFAVFSNKLKIVPVYSNCYCCSQTFRVQHLSQEVQTQNLPLHSSKIWVRQNQVF